MTDIVPADQIEQIVGAHRHPTAHLGRAVSANETVYILHSRACLDSGLDLRECSYSTALDRGIDPDAWEQNATVLLVVERGVLMPLDSLPADVEQLGLFPPLTAEEFDAGCGYTINGIPLCENEDGDHVYASGHIYRGDFAEAVTAFDREMAGYDDEATSPQDVEHVWAVTTKPADDPDGWWIQWGGVTKDTPNAFALTVVAR